MTTPTLEAPTGASAFQESLAGLANAIAFLGVMGEHCKQAALHIEDRDKAAQYHKAAASQATRIAHILESVHGELVKFVENTNAQHKPRIVGPGGK